MTCCVALASTKGTHEAVNLPLFSTEYKVEARARVCPQNRDDPCSVSSHLTQIKSCLDVTDQFMTDLADSRGFDPGWLCSHVAAFVVGLPTTMAAAVPPTRQPRMMHQFFSHACRLRRWACRTPPWHCPARNRKVTMKSAGANPMSGLNLQLRGGGRRGAKAGGVEAQKASLLKGHSQSNRERELTSLGKAKPHPSSHSAPTSHRMVASSW